MFELNGKQYTLAQVEAAAAKSNKTLDEYIQATGLITLEPGKTTPAVQGAAVEETAAPEQPSTELESVDTSLVSQPKRKSVRGQQRAKELERIAEKKKQDQQLQVEEDWAKDFASAVESPNFSDLNQDQLLKIQDKAIEELTSKYKDEEEYSFDETDVRLKAASIFENKVLPNVSLEEDTALERFVKEKAPIFNPYADFISDIYTAGSQGLKTSELVDPTFELLKKGSGSSDEDIITWIEANKKIAAENMQSDEMRDFNRIYEENGSGVFGFIKGVANNPSIMPSLLVSSIATQIGSLRSEEVALAAAAGAGTGAAVGSVVPGAGTITGAIGGAIGGGAAAMEASLTFSELLQEEVGEDLNIEAVRTLFEDEEKVADLQRKAVSRGIAIGLVEGLTGSVAKGVTGKVLKAGLKKPVATVAGVGVESIGGGLGEVAGRIAADQKMDIAEIGFEAITGTTTAPITVGSELIALDNRIANYQINKELKNTNFTNIEQAFSPDASITEAQVKISQNKKAQTILDNNLKRSVLKGEITQEQADETKRSFLETQGAVNNIKPLKLNEQDQAKAVDLIKEKKNLQQEIKRVNEPSLTEAQSDRINEIDNSLREIGRKAKAQETKKVEKVVSQLEKVGVKTMSTEEIQEYLQAKNLVKDQEQAIRKSGEGAFIVQDETTGEQEIVVNKDLGSISDPSHEALHAIIFKTVSKNPEAAVNLGKALEAELNKIDENLIEDSGIKDRLELYKSSPESIKMEEVLTLFSDAIRAGNIKFNETVFTKIGDFIRQVLQKAGVKANFNTGRDVFNFVRDYQKSIESGKLTRGQVRAAKEGIKGKLITKPQQVQDVETIIKESRSEEASQEVQRIYEEQGVDGAFDIIEQFKPITNKIVDRRREAPGFNREDLTSEIEFGKRGILDLIREYDPESGVPLAAYINKFLPARAIEASNRVLGEEFTEDVTEARGVAAEEVVTEVTEEARGPKKPTETTKFNRVVLENLGVENKQQAEKQISDATKEAFEGQEITRFGQTKNVPKSVAEIYGKMFGVNPETIYDKKRNYSKKDAEGLTRIKQYLIDNAASDYARLPRTKDDFGKATFIPNNVMNALYTDGKLTGTLKDYIDLVREKPVKPIYRDRVGQTIRGLFNTSIRNRMVEDLIPVKAERARAGVKFSKAKPKDVNKELQEIAIATDINQAAKIANIKGKVTVNDNNRLEKQKQMQQAIIDAEIPSWMFEGSKFGNFGRRKVDNKYVDIPTRGGLYYGKSDPAFQAALALAKTNDSKYDIKAPKRVNVNKAFTEQGQAQSADNLKALEFMANKLADAVAKGQMPVEIAALFISSGYQATSGIIKIAAPFKYKSKSFKYGTAPNQNKGEKFREEHNPPASVIGANLIYGIANNDMATILPAITKNYYQTQLSKADDQKLDDTKLDATLPAGTTIADNSAIRFIEAGIDLNSIVNYETGQTMAEELGVALKSSDVNVDTVFEQNKILKEVLSGDITAKTGQDRLNEFAKLKSIPNAGVNNNNKNNTIKFSKQVPNQEILDNLGNADQAMANARNLEAPVKKIRVFDFDDTLAKSNSQVLYELPDGTTGKLNATQFAERSSELQEQGAEFDFSEFSKVVDGKKGPVFKAVENIVKARGAEDVFILTARPANAAGSIKEFMDALGVNLPIENIVGLGDGTAQAKARWMTAKAAEGYNDFFFVDDAYKNVKAVQDALDVFDVKSKTQQAKIKFSKKSNLDKDFNNILEQTTGIASEKEYKRVKAEVAGASKGRFNFFIPPSAEDFVGLLYDTLSKGKLGDAQMAWYKKHLLNPYGRAMNELSSARIALMNDYKQLKKQLDLVPKNLRKKVPGEPFTREQAVRVYIWNKQGMEVPGISEADLKDLTEYVQGNSDLQMFADQLIAMQKGDQYAKPKEGWPAGTITTDLLEGLNTTKRAKYLEQWQENVDVIFSEKNLNKLEAAYGKGYRKALENMLSRMKSGRNRSFAGDSLTGRVTDWLTGSIGTIMFFNTRSALLQTISSINFVNFTDNNILAAGKAFANQKQFWSDFMTLMNSDFLKERRGGLRINVNEADIADMAKKGGVRGVINKLLEFGFTPTQIADSFAIASGGATFYRNRIKTLKKQGLSDADAEAQAFVDFREIAEESQQSSRPDRISMQQAGPLGRIILAFANTPAQYARLIKKAARDLKAGRGDAKTNISKIIYYGVAQNLLFNALQQAIFAFGFGDEEPEDEEKQEKYISIANGMLDSLLRGMGIGGAVLSVGKNSIKRIFDEMEKKQPKLEKVGYELTKISPPISAKLSRINQAARSYQWDKKEMQEKGWSLDNPAYLAGANVVSALTNIPVDRAIKKTNNVVQATSQDLETWERLALLGGWQDWEIGIDKETKTNKPQPRKTKRKQREKTRKETIR